VIDERRAASLARAYLSAKSAVLNSAYAVELVCTRTSIIGLSEAQFLREFAWVVLSAGMAERVVRSRFDGVSESFLNWRSAVEITEAAQTCVASALVHFAHERKIRAIAEGAKLVNEKTFPVLWAEIDRDPLMQLRQFPYIGPITAFHLAKNLGINTAKPDRHMNRLCSAAGFTHVEDFCGSISRFVGDDVRTVDTVLWRFATLNPDYLNLFVAAAECVTFSGFRQSEFQQT